MVIGQGGGQFVGEGGLAGVVHSVDGHPQSGAGRRDPRRDLVRYLSAGRRSHLATVHDV
jgi:hypothetical protein